MVDKLDDIFPTVMTPCILVFVLFVTILGVIFLAAAIKDTWRELWRKDNSQSS